MSNSKTNPMTPQDKDLFAAEYAMGLITGDDEARAAHLLTTDPEFAAMHSRWRERLTDIDLTATPQAPGDRLWSRIEASLPAAQGKPAEARTNASAPSALAVQLGSLWESLKFWRPAGLVAVVASLVLAVSLGFTMRDAARQPVLVAVLMTDANQPGAIVNVSADGRAELVPLGDIPVPPGRVLQIWTLWDRVRGPVSVGLAQSARKLDLDVKALPRTTPSQLFEITLEPAGGSPTGRPTGPILMKGNATTAL